jgi:branched-chain amino acid transport system permease protein
MKKTKLGWPIFALLVVVIPFIFKQDYFIHLLVLTGMNIILATSLNMISGYAGMIQLCQSAFWGVGAYTSTILVMSGWNSWLALPISGIVASIFGLLIGIPSLRVTGHYFSIVTISFQMFINLSLSQWYKLTNGNFGITGIPSFSSIAGITFDSLRNYYFLVFAFVFLTLFILNRVVHSRVGLSLLAIKESNMAAESCGINVIKMKLVAFLISSFFAGIAGSLFAHYVRNIHPSSFTMWASMTIHIMVLMGGRGTFIGPIIGATLLTLLPEYLRAFQKFRMIGYGLALILLVLFMPYGIIGALKSSRSKLILRRNKQKQNNNGK